MSKIELTDDEFTSALNAEDHIGMVIRAHIHVEHWLEQFLGASIPRYTKYAKYITPDYESKVHLCCAVGLSEDLKALWGDASADVRTAF